MRSAFAQLGSPAAHILDILGNPMNFRADSPAIAFELGFARPPGPDAAAQPRERFPGANKTGQEVLQLRELHLQLPFPGPSTPREDVQDQLRTVDDLPVYRF